MSEQPMKPFEESRKCPQCEGDAAVDRYGAVNSYLRDSNGRLMQFGYTPQQPHLVIRCSTCGWEWLSETRQGSQP